MMRVIGPMVLLLAAVGVSVILVRQREPETHEVPEPLIPLVRVVEAGLGTHRYTVHAQGTVQPTVEISLSAEVAGRVTAVAPGFVVGGFFEADEVLVRLDTRDHELALERARAALAEAEVRLTREEAESALARTEWNRLQREREPSPLVVREPQLAEARATVASARAGVRQAELDLERCLLRAPFAGRVREKTVDVGQYVGRAQVVARVFSIESAEVRLPMPVSELEFLSIDPAGHRAGISGEGAPTGPEVVLEAVLGRRIARWKGHVVRTEGEMDPRTRMLNLVVRVEDPYGRRTAAAAAGREGADGAVAGTDTSPLWVGLFVKATLSGRETERLWRVPRSAMRGEDRLLVVDAEDRLRIRSVRVVRMEGETALLGTGLVAGDRPCISPLATPVDGMRVRVSDASGTVSASAADSPGMGVGGWGLTPTAGLGGGRHGH
jgi:multidrug efflux system membrane fusion protein